MRNAPVGLVRTRSVRGRRRAGATAAKRAPHGPGRAAGDAKSGHYTWLRQAFSRMRRGSNACRRAASAPPECAGPLSKGDERHAQAACKSPPSATGGDWGRLGDDWEATGGDWGRLGATGRRLGGDWEATGRRLGSDREATGKRLGSDRGTTGKRRGPRPEPPAPVPRRSAAQRHASTTTRFSTCSLRWKKCSAPGITTTGSSCGRAQS